MWNGFFHKKYEGEYLGGHLEVNGVQMAIRRQGSLVYLFFFSFEITCLQHIEDQRSGNEFKPQ
jgi:hypothetical protein